MRARSIAEKVDAAGRHVRQVELCIRHCEVVIVREHARGLEISDRRSECPHGQRSAQSEIPRSSRISILCECGGSPCSER